LLVEKKNQVAGWLKAGNRHRQVDLAEANAREDAIMLTAGPQGRKHFLRKSLPFISKAPLVSRL
jgi:hypothetical protein